MLDRLARTHDPTSATIAQAPMSAIGAANTLDTARSRAVRPEQEIDHDALVLLVHVGAGRGDAADLASFCDERRNLGLGDHAAAIGRRREPRDIDRKRVAVLHPGGRRIGDEIEARGIGSPDPRASLAEPVELADQHVAALMGAIVNGDLRNARFDQRKRDRGSGPAGPDQQRPHPPGVDPPGPPGPDETKAIDHVAMPRAVGTPAHQVYGAEKMRALCCAGAALVAGKFVRDGHDNAVEILQPGCNREEIGQVGSRDLHGNEDAIMAARSKGCRHTRGRAHLRDGIANDDKEPRCASKSRDHEDYAGTWEPSVSAAVSYVKSNPASPPSFRHLASSRRNATGPRQYWLFRAAIGSNT